MSTIPLPALHINPPTPQASPFEQLAQLQQLRNAPLQTQALQQQVQLGQQQVQTGQMEMAARQGLQQAFQAAVVKDANGRASFDPDKLQENLANGPAAYKIPEVMEGITKFQKGRIDLQNAQLDSQQKQADILGAAASAVKAANYDPTLAHSLLDNLPPSPQIQQIRSQIDNPQALKQVVDSAIQASSKQRELGAQESTAAARTLTAQTEAQKLQASMNPQSSLYAPSPASVALGTAPGAAQIQQGEARQAALKSGAEEQAKMPGEMMLARQKQALSQGDPQAAGQLLVSGDATLSQLKARGATPEFIQQSLNAAHQISGGKYNAQQAEAQFDVAKSAANVAFFGSSKSLTDPGGTLDQLAEIGKKIPGGLIPAFNSIADWEKAATGSGPIAKYAATALGVADDYAKVMGGGQGSDTSRMQALNLIGAKQSPEQRAASIEGIRGAVGSQTASRIGKNPILQKMYGAETSPAAASSLSVTAPNGKTYTFKDQASADAFKQKAGIP